MTVKKDKNQKPTTSGESKLTEKELDQATGGRFGETSPLSKSGKIKEPSSNVVEGYDNTPLF